MSLNQKNNTLDPVTRNFWRLCFRFLGPPGSSNLDIFGNVSLTFASVYLWVGFDLGQACMRVKIAIRALSHVVTVFLVIPEELALMSQFFQQNSRD